MIPVIGLGNPGKEYINSRHNVGWHVLDMLSGNQEWTYDKYLLSNKTMITISDKQILLLKPETFMNNSGQVIEGLNKINPFTVSQLIVIQDDIDLAIGVVKIVYDRGDGGHNGIKSINQHFGGKKYIRIRIGISKKGEDGTIHKPNVLGNFDEQDQDFLKTALPKAVLALEKIIQNGFDAASNEINQK